MMHLRITTIILTFYQSTAVINLVNVISPQLIYGFMKHLLAVFITEVILGQQTATWVKQDILLKASSA